MDLTNINVIKDDIATIRMLIKTDGGVVVAIPEERWTDDQKAIAAEFENQFPNGRPLPTPSEPQNEPVDHERVAMAEAIIDLSSQIDDLKNQINILNRGK